MKFSMASKFLCKRFSKYVARKNLMKDVSHIEATYLCKNESNEFYKSKPENIPISFWHDIPIFELEGSVKNPIMYDELINSQDFEGLTFNIVIEIPKNTSAKYEVNKELSFNPIIQDSKILKSTNQAFKRFIKLPYNINYGMIPQTWENSYEEILPGHKGDDDPLDVFEISGSSFFVGDVVSVEVVGSFCLIDQNEVDWKILCVSKKYLDAHSITADEMFNEFKVKGSLTELLAKLKKYKIYEGKKPNVIYQNDKIFDKVSSIKTILQSHKDYLAHKKI